MKKYWLLALITLLGLGLRLWQLNELPTVLNRDEAGLAYNAFLLKESGKDEWGRSWPLALESFGDYKLPGYSLMLVSLFSVLGESEAVVRLPSVIAGTLLILLSYAFARKLDLKPTYAALLALLISISPVFVFYSRMAFEANVAMFLLISLMYVCFFPFKRRILRLMVPLILAVMGIFTYNTPFIVLPFLIACLPFINGWKNYKKWGILAVGLLAVWIASAALLLPLNNRKSGITIFSDPHVYYEYTQYREQLSPQMLQLIGSKYVYWAGLVARNVVASFSPEFVVIKGGSHPWHQVPGTAHLYWLVYLFSAVGISWSVKEIVTSWQKERQLNFKPLATLYFLAVSLIPAVITVDAPHATRSLLFFGLLIYFAVFGLSKVVKSVNPTYAKYVLGVFIVVLMIEALVYGYRYFIMYPTQQHSLRPGYSQALGEYYQKYGSPVTVLDQEGYQYIVTAWYQRLHPTVFLATVRRDPPNTIGFTYVNQTGDVMFVKSLEEAREKQVPAVLIWNDDTNRWQIDTLQ